ncbi:MAG TPA: tetratricopeptide repeat protein [Fimbriimonadaceae bacterium]|nr:tetratricopeptide repeat protein [Fimbriimonadaceae bacterium]
MLFLIALTALNPDSPMKFDGLGPHHRHITTRSREAEDYFNEGLEFMYGFNKGEAITLFKAAAKADPKCAMAYWGIATANGPDINNPGVGPDQAMEAWEALQAAKKLDASPVEKALIQASEARFANPQPADRTGLDRAYADEMRKVWKRFPRDSDVGALFAESLMDLRPWHQWNKEGTAAPGTMEAIETCRAVLRFEPNHPQALHLLIHATEGSPHPEWGTQAANRLRFLQPGLGHMVHMPSHNDVRTGEWQKAVEANERAIQADLAYRKKRNKMSMYRFYMVHNWHMLGYASMMIGESKKSLHAIDSMFAPLSDVALKNMGPFVDGYVAMPLEARIRFGKWDEILATPEYPDYYPISRTLQHYARGIAYAAKGQVTEAKEEQDKFEFGAAGLTGNEAFGNNTADGVISLARHMLAGEIALAENHLDEAVTELRAGVAAEDGLNYDEPPAWILPVRHALGATLMKAGRYAEAEKVYRQDLAKLPHNGWSLYGLGQALMAEGKAAEANKVQGEFAVSWRHADMKIGSSCMCVNGKP